MKKYQVSYISEIRNPISITFRLINDDRQPSVPGVIRTQSILTIPYNDSISLFEKAKVPYFLDDKNKKCFISKDILTTASDYERVNINGFISGVMDQDDLGGELIRSVLELAKVKYACIKDGFVVSGFSVIRLWPSSILKLIC